MLTEPALSSATLWLMMEQSVDCVKFVSLDGKVRWMNQNGLCALEIDEFSAVEGHLWADMWPTETRVQIADAYDSAATGTPARFTAFCPTIRGTPRWWDVSVTRVKDEAGSPIGYLSISRDVTDRQNHARTLDLAYQEMRHRLSNTYAIVGSMVSGFARGTADLEQFAREMQERFRAMHAAQTLFADDQHPRRLDNLLQAIVKPFVDDDQSVTFGYLSPRQISTQIADTIALALGELTVNSVKHGALGDGGELALSTVETDAAISIVWQENPCRAVAAVTRDGGQGLNLIDKIVRTRGGTITLAWQPDGLTATLCFPWSSPAN